MADLPPPPKAYKDFVARYPGLAGAWDLINEAGTSGPLKDPALRLLKLAIAIGAMREGAVRASVRKARALGISRDAIEQVVALGASTLGLPATVAVYGWVQQGIDQGDVYNAEVDAEEPEEAAAEDEGGDDA